VKEPADLRDQVAQFIKTIRTWKADELPNMAKEWWNNLQKALNANGELEVLSKEAIDDYDHLVKEGLGILQLLVMQKCPTAANGFWSPVLKKVN